MISSYATYTLLLFHVLRPSSASDDMKDTITQILESKDSADEVAHLVNIRSILSRDDAWTRVETDTIVRHVQSEIADYRAHARLHITNNPEQLLCSVLSNLIPSVTHQVSLASSSPRPYLILSGLLGDLYRYRSSHCSKSSKDRSRDEQVAIICYTHGLDTARKHLGEPNYLLSSSGVRLKRNLAAVVYHQRGNEPLALAHLEDIIRAGNEAMRLSIDLSDEVKVNIEQCRQLAAMWKRSLSDEDGFEIL